MWIFWGVNEKILNLLRSVSSYGRGFADRENKESKLLRRPILQRVCSNFKAIFVDKFLTPNQAMPFMFQ